MSTIYNKAFRVPVWVVLQESPVTKAVADYLFQNGAEDIPWPSTTFAQGVKAMGRKGWSHLVDQKYPYFLDATFLPIAASNHIKSLFGDQKMLSGAPSRPWNHVIDRKVTKDEDYTRIFDQIMELEDAVSLSHLFDIGNKCYGNSVKTHVFFSRGNIPRNVLQRISDSVIVVGEQGEVPTKDRTVEQVIGDLETAVVAALRLNKA